jgi:shingomyelin synthase
MIGLHEKWKALGALFFLILSVFVALTSLALTHDRLPDRKIYKPLPDVILDNVKNIDFLLNVTEIQLMIGFNGTIILVFFHRHR